MTLLLVGFLFWNGSHPESSLCILHSYKKRTFKIPPKKLFVNSSRIVVLSLSWEEARLPWISHKFCFCFLLLGPVWGDFVVSLLNLSCFSWWLRKERIFSPLRFLNGENTTCNWCLWAKVQLFGQCGLWNTPWVGLVLSNSSRSGKVILLIRCNGGPTRLGSTYQWQSLR